MSSDQRVLETHAVGVRPEVAIIDTLYIKSTLEPFLPAAVGLDPLADISTGEPDSTRIRSAVRRISSLADGEDGETDVEREIGRAGLVTLEVECDPTGCNLGGGSDVVGEERLLVEMAAERLRGDVRTLLAR